MKGKLFEVAKCSIILIVVPFIILILLFEVAPFINRPEQVEKVEVVEKRIYESSSEGKTRYYIVAFRFPDGFLTVIE